MPIKTTDIPPGGYIEMTEDEYLVHEAEAEYKSEFRQGRVYDMSGGTEAHSTIIGNTFSVIRPQLRGRPCKGHMSSLRTKIAAAGLYTYPDIMVVCGPSIFDTKDKNALTNPTLIIEILSKSTQVYDRGEKFNHYKKLDSLQTYVLISQSQILVERYTREGGEWVATQLHTLQDTLDLPAIGCQVTLRDIYEDVDFAAIDED